MPILSLVEVHSSRAWDMLKDYYMGPLKEEMAKPQGNLLLKIPSTLLAERMGTRCILSVATVKEMTSACSCLKGSHPPADSWLGCSRFKLPFGKL